MRIGVLGGTFDPPHIGHLILAEQAREQLQLDRVLWVPAADPPHKQGVVILPVEHRIEMVRRSIADNAAFSLSTVDADRPGPHYTVDMLDLLTVQFQGSEFYFLIGGDSLRDLPRWHEPSRLVEQAMLAVMSRPGVTYDLFTLEEAVPGIRERLLFLETVLVDISGRAIRLGAATGRSVRYLVPDAVHRYIIDHQLYLADPLE